MDPDTIFVHNFINQHVREREAWRRAFLQDDPIDDPNVYHVLPQLRFGGAENAITARFVRALREPNGGSAASAMDTTPWDPSVRLPPASAEEDMLVRALQRAIAGEDTHMTIPFTKQNGQSSSSLAPRDLHSGESGDRDRHSPEEEARERTSCIFYLRLCSLQRKEKEDRHSVSVVERAERRRLVQLLLSRALEQLLIEEFESRRSLFRTFMQERQQLKTSETSEVVSITGFHPRALSTLISFQRREHAYRASLMREEQKMRDLIKKQQTLFELELIDRHLRRCSRKERVLRKNLEQSLHGSLNQTTRTHLN